MLVQIIERRLSRNREAVAKSMHRSCKEWYLILAHILTFFDLQKYNNSSTWQKNISARYATVVTVQNNTLGLGSAMGKWNCYAVTVTHGVSNPNDRLGEMEL